MKLRLRSFETKETLKIEIPNPCNLQQLKEIVSQKTSNLSTVYFSLNRKHNLTTKSPEESIQSTGITSGDLIYFTTNPNGFSTVPKSQNTQTLIPNSSIQDETLFIITSKKAKTVDSSNSNSEDITVTESMELGDDNGFNHKLFVLAVRAILLESGFVEIDPATNLLKYSNSDFQGNLHLTSFYYTLPNIITSDNIKTVKIKFQYLGKYCKVYGCLVNETGVHSVHSVLLDEDILVPFFNAVWANCGPAVVTVTDFWRKMKDGLTLPLLIDLCEKAGFPLPPCFMQLPTELKFKILESVSGVDLAKVSCVCSELRYLGSSDDLWKQKCIERFGSVVGSDNRRTFKERFAKTWESRKRRRNSKKKRRNPYVPLGEFRDPLLNEVKLECEAAKSRWREIRQ